MKGATIAKLSLFLLCVLLERYASADLQGFEVCHIENYENDSAISYDDGITLNCICIPSPARGITWWRGKSKQIEQGGSVGIESRVEGQLLYSSKLTITGSQLRGRVCCKTDRSNLCVNLTFSPPPFVNISVIDYHYLGNGSYLVLISCTLRTQKETVRDNALSVVIQNTQKSTNEYILTKEGNESNGKSVHFSKEQQIYENVSYGSVLYCEYLDPTTYKSFQSMNLSFLPTLYSHDTEGKSSNAIIVISGAVGGSVVIIGFLILMICACCGGCRRLLLIIHCAVQHNIETGPNLHDLDKSSNSDQNITNPLPKDNNENGDTDSETKVLQQGNRFSKEDKEHRKTREALAMETLEVIGEDKECVMEKLDKIHTDVNKILQNSKDKDSLAGSIIDSMV